MQSRRIIAIVGTRTTGKDQYFECLRKVKDIFQHINKEDIVISGGANSGADKLARTISFTKGVNYLEAPAYWYPNGKLDKAAGLKRNTIIAELCTHCVAVWDGKSGGTKDTLSKVQKLGKPLWIIPM